MPCPPANAMADTQLWKLSPAFWERLAGRNPEAVKILRAHGVTHAELYYSRAVGLTRLRFPTLPAQVVGHAFDASLAHDDATLCLPGDVRRWRGPGEVSGPRLLWWLALGVGWLLGTLVLWTHCAHWISTGDNLHVLAGFGTMACAPPLAVWLLAQVA